VPKRAVRFLQPPNSRFSYSCSLTSIICDGLDASEAMISSIVGRYVLRVGSPLRGWLSNARVAGNPT
jgi:hypothetical protein